MTDKIIIDGVDVSNCNYYSEMEFIRNYNGYTEYPDYCNISNSACSEHPNCHYKQLQRKTAECEELKKAAFTLAEGLNFRQKKLEEIENFAKRHCNTCEDNGQQLCSSNYCYRHYLLDIINKAKE